MAVLVHENIWIPLADGRRLSARLWLPDGPAAARVPVVIEYMPYRKRDATRPRDEPIHSWFAAHGYAGLRVDMHGSGDSDGLLKQEFQAGEREDGVEIIAWAAAQDWCDGGVAMLGKSWGGFSAIHAAMLRPPALRAIIVVCAGDDRYDQSLHYTGGALLNQQLWWNDAMLVFNMRAPDPEISGANWEALWRVRLDDVEPWIGEWLNHQHRDSFWRENSVADDYSAIECPVYAVGGWADYISRSVPRLVAGLGGRRYGLVGPWGHHYPHDGIPGPAIGFMQECKRFLDSVMKGTADFADEPLLRAWMPEVRVAGPAHAEQAGRWIAERAWPSPRIAPQVLHLNANGLSDSARATVALQHRSPQTVGLCGSEWLSQGVPGEAPLDQREDDGKSLCFDTAPLTGRLEIFGCAVLDLDIAADRPFALVAARLNDIAPDGTSVRVALGILNLTHRESDAAPRPVVPGERMRVRLTLPETAHGFGPGHRIRIALSTAYWPIVWPSPAPVTLTLHTGTSTLTLPARPPDPGDAALRAFDPPEAGPAAPLTILEPPRLSRTLVRDLLTGAHVLTVAGDGGFLGPGRRYRLDDTGTIMGHTIRQRSEIREDDPLAARIDLEQTYEMERGDWRIRLETATRFSATETEFLCDVEARAWNGADLVLDRRWHIAKPRDLV